MNDRQRELHLKFQRDLFFFAKHAPLVIKTKGGELRPLTLNKAQAYIHQRLEDMKARTGKVRAIIVKARQEGASTYIAARFYHQTTRRPGTSTFILAHDRATTEKLFNMVKRFHEKADHRIVPPTATSNQRILKFDSIESDYAVGTAGNDSGGRGGTVQLFHGSEVAYWANTTEIEKGVMESIPDLSGTEIILESTANGLGNMFHQRAMAALEGKGDYELIFVPWFWMDEYSREFPAGSILTTEEEKYRSIYSLSLEQIAWRRAKIDTLGKGNFQRGLDMFKQEYPANIHEAFETSGDKFFDPVSIMRARKSKLTDKQAPLIIGVDPARSGDRTVMVYRRGREVPHYQVWEEMTPMQLAGIIVKAIKTHAPDAVFVDMGGGEGTVDRVHELGFDKIVHGVYFGESASDPKAFANKRAEMYSDAREWLEDPGGAKLPDDDTFHKDLAVIPKFKPGLRQQLPPKEFIKAECGFSPDLTDALVLTFAHPVEKLSYAAPEGQSISKTNTIRTLSRIRKAS